jgi:hypothetical protein
MAVTIKDAVFLYMTPCDSGKNRSFEGTYPLLYKRLFHSEDGGDVFLLNVGSDENHTASSYPGRQHP